MRVLLSTIACLLAFAAPADAHPLLGGLLEVELPGGRTLLTHGDDPAGAAPGTAFSDAPERPPLCASTHVQHVLYGHPVKRVNRSLVVAEQLRKAVRQANGVLYRAAVESGNRSADYRVLCDATLGIQVDSFVNAGASSFAGVVAAAMAAGYDVEGRNYTIFYDDPSSDECGWGSVHVDDRLTAANANNAGGAYSVLYPRCWDPETVLHETAHNLGAVQDGAPNSTGAGHCDDEQDVMCYEDGSGVAMRTSCSGEPRFDCGDDDYFDTAPEPGEYLATHWNLGSPLNRFIVFGEPDPEPVVTEPPPEEDPFECLDCEWEPELPVRIVRGSLRLAPDGRVRLTLLCPRARWVACRGTVRLERRGGGRLARRGFRVGIGRRRTLKLRLPARSRRLPRLAVRAIARDPEADRLGRAAAVLRAPAR